MSWFLGLLLLTLLGALFGSTRSHGGHRGAATLVGLAAALVLVGCGLVDWELVLPGEQPLPPDPTPRRGAAGIVHLDEPGVVHIPRRGDPNETIDIQAGDSYRRMELELDVTHGGWFASEPDKNHSIFWLHRGHDAFAGNAIAYANAFGPPRNEIRLANNLTTPRGARMDAVRQRGVRLASGQTYHVRYTYDGSRGTTELVLSRDGNVVAQLSGRAPLRSIEAPRDRTFFVWLGHRNSGPAGPERPTYGWRYANLKVRLVP